MPSGGSLTCISYQGADSSGPSPEHRAFELTWLLGVEFERKPARTPAEYATIRDEVRAAARRELDRAE
jgi:hypothetical protein